MSTDKVIRQYKMDTLLRGYSLVAFRFRFSVVAAEKTRLRSAKFARGFVKIKPSDHLRMIGRCTLESIKYRIRCENKIVIYIPCRLFTLLLILL